MSPQDRMAGNAHRRAQRALAERHAGVLEAAEETWLDAHLEDCAECQAIAQALADGTRVTGGGRGHLPAHLISRWGTESRSMPDVVRDYVISHLRACEQCRMAFAIVGQPLPPELAAAARDRPAADRAGVLKRWFRGSRAGYWVMGGGLAAAAAALVAVFSVMERTKVVATNNGQALRPGQTNVRPNPALDTTITPPKSPRDTGHTGKRQEGVPLLALAGGEDSDVQATDVFPLDQSTVRGTEAPDSVRAFSVPHDARAIRLSHPEPALMAREERDSVTITITTPSGRRLGCVARIGDLRFDQPLVLRIPSGIEPGTYRYEYAFGGHGAPPIRGEIRIELR